MSRTLAGRFALVTGASSASERALSWHWRQLESQLRSRPGAPTV